MCVREYLRARVCVCSILTLFFRLYNIVCFVHAYKLRTNIFICLMTVLRINIVVKSSSDLLDF